MSQIRVHQDHPLEVYVDFQLQRCVAEAFDDRDGGTWRFTSHKCGVVAQKRDKNGHTHLPREWHTLKVHRVCEDRSPWPMAVKSAAAEALDGFPSMSGVADVAFEIALSR